MRPSEIAKLTEQARRGKALFASAEPVAAKAKLVFDEFEQTMDMFNAHVSDTSKQTAALKAMMAEMGNAGPVLEATFQDEKATGPVSAKPEEVAHLPKANGG
jgi:hypothetical protein